MTDDTRISSSGRILAISTFVALATVAMSAVDAQASKEANTNAGAGVEHLPLQHQAYVMMGHVEVADVALLNGYSVEAKRHVNEALTLARKLEGQTAKLNAESVKAGHLQYGDASGQKHDFWLPVVNDSMVVDNLSESFGGSAKPSRAADEAELVTVKVSIDVKAILADLEKASKALAAKDDAAAQAALRDAEQNVFSEEAIRGEPLATARDNLVLARELLKSKDYKAAGVALRHSEVSLKDYEKLQSDQAKNTRVVKLQQQIDQLQGDLSKDKPSLLAEAEGKVDHWIQDIKSL